MSKIVEQARAMAKQVRFEDSEHIPNTDVFKESADLIDTLAAELERERKLATGYDSLIHELEEERDALREKLEALSKPVSMEPVDYQYVFDNVLKENFYTATQLAAARQQGAEDQTEKTLEAVRVASERIAELEQKNAVLLEALRKVRNNAGTPEAVYNIAKEALAIAEVKP